MSAAPELQIADRLFASCSRKIALPLSSEGGGRLRFLEGLELGRLDLERLLSLEAKFAKEGLTFDDVLLVPGESGVLPNDVSTRTRFTRGISIEVPTIDATTAAVAGGLAGLGLLITAAGFATRRERGGGGPQPA